LFGGWSNGGNFIQASHEALVEMIYLFFGSLLEKGMYAISGRTGSVIWKISPTQGDPIIFTSNFYTPLLISVDVDEDGLNDLIVMHGGDPLRKPTDRIRISARLLLLSARTGKTFLVNICVLN
jgi:hypothetical protein